MKHNIELPEVWMHVKGMLIKERCYSERKEWDNYKIDLKMISTIMCLYIVFKSIKKLL